MYFGNPQTKDGPLFTHADVDKLQSKLRENLKHMHETSESSSPRTVQDDQGRQDSRSDTPTTSKEQSQSKPEKGKDQQKDDQEKSDEDEAVLHENSQQGQADEKPLVNKGAEEPDNEESDADETREENVEGEEESDSDNSDSDNETKNPEAGEEKEKEQLCSPTQTKFEEGIEGLYDESLLHGLGEEDFVFSFDEKTFYDGKVLARCFSVHN